MSRTLITILERNIKDKKLLEKILIKYVKKYADIVGQIKNQTEEICREAVKQKQKNNKIN